MLALIGWCRRPDIEPAHHTVLAPQASASTNSATSAFNVCSAGRGRPTSRCRRRTRGCDAGAGGSRPRAEPRAIRCACVAGALGPLPVLARET